MTTEPAVRAVQSARRAMFRLQWWEPMAVFFVAMLVRIYRIGEVTNFLDDRWLNVPTAFNYVRHGLMGPDNWFTQPVKHFLMNWTISVFGNDPIGWGMRQVLFGSVLVLLTFLLSRRVFRAHFPALMASALVALDPLLISFSRASSEDPLATVFMLAALFFWVRAIQEGSDWDLLAAGVLIGVAAATRWYALLPAALMFVITLVHRRRDGVPGLAKSAALLSLVPLSAYLVWFLPWFARGYSLGEFVALQVDSFLVQRTSAYPAFDPALAPLIGPERWFFGWVGVSTNTAVRTFTVIMNDPVLWAFFIPAMAYLAWIAFRRRLPEHWLIFGTFATLYAFFVLVDRPIYLYSAIPLVPLGFMAVGYAASRLLRRWAVPALAAAVAWSLYLYPLTSAIQVPLTPYAWLLTRVGMGGGG